MQFFQFLLIIINLHSLNCWKLDPLYLREQLHYPSRQSTIRVDCKYDHSDPELQVVIHTIIFPQL